MCSASLPDELEEIVERLKVEFGVDRLTINPLIEERLFRLARAEIAARDGIDKPR